MFQKGMVMRATAAVEPDGLIKTSTWINASIIKINELAPSAIIGVPTDLRIIKQII